MLDQLLGVFVAVLLVLAIHKLFFSADGNIKNTAPFWLLPYRMYIQKRPAAAVARELTQYGPVCYVWFGLDKRVVVNDVDLARVVYAQHDSYPKVSRISPNSTMGK